MRAAWWESFLLHCLKPNPWHNKSIPLQPTPHANTMQRLVKSRGAEIRNNTFHQLFDWSCKVPSLVHSQPWSHSCLLYIQCGGLIALHCKWWCQGTADKLELQGEHQSTGASNKVSNTTSSQAFNPFSVGIPTAKVSFVWFLELGFKAWLRTVTASRDPAPHISSTTLKFTIVAVN